MSERYTLIPDETSNAIFDNEKGETIAWIANSKRAKEIVEKINAKDSENKEKAGHEIKND